MLLPPNKIVVPGARDARPYRSEFTRDESSWTPPGSAYLQILDCAERLIDSFVGVGVRTCIGIGYGDTSKTLTADHPGLLVFPPIRIEKRIRRVGVAVGPAIYSDALNVIGCVETGRTQHLGQLLANITDRKSTR